VYATGCAEFARCETQSVEERSAAAEEHRAAFAVHLDDRRPFGIFFFAMGQLFVGIHARGGLCDIIVANVPEGCCRR
jgi:hypothetical protein